MEIIIKFKCDNCLETFEFSAAREGALSTWKSVQSTDIREIMSDNHWYFLRTCLCPKCKAKVGENNCMNCIHLQNSGANFRCDGFASHDKPLVSMFDACTYFEDRRLRNEKSEQHNLETMSIL